VCKPLVFENHDTKFSKLKEEIFQKLLKILNYNTIVLVMGILNHEKLIASYNATFSKIRKQQGSQSDQFAKAMSDQNIAFITLLNTYFLENNEDEFSSVEFAKFHDHVGNCFRDYMEILRSRQYVLKYHEIQNPQTGFFLKLLTSHFQNILTVYPVFENQKIEDLHTFRHLAAQCNSSMNSTQNSVFSDFLQTSDGSDQFDIDQFNIDQGEVESSLDVDEDEDSVKSTSDVELDKKAKSNVTIKKMSKKSNDENRKTPCKNIF
jgi:hypothetical protein